MGKPSKTNLFATNMIYRLPILITISGMTNHCDHDECLLFARNYVLDVDLKGFKKVGFAGP